MSWVLILTPNANARMTGAAPAVIGGYRTKEEAEAAGRIAVDPFRGDAEKEAQWEKEEAAADVDDWHDLPHVDWTGYVVIPGAADTAPESGEGSRT